jgi:hypothetical protein
VSIHHQGMKHEGHTVGRGDEKAGDVGDKTFGKSGGGHGALTNDLISSPMSPDMLGKRAQEEC